MNRTHNPTHGASGGAMTPLPDDRWPVLDCVLWWAIWFYVFWYVIIRVASLVF